MWPRHRRSSNARRHAVPKKTAPPAGVQQGNPGSRGGFYCRPSSASSERLPAPNRRSDLEGDNTIHMFGGSPSRRDDRRRTSPPRADSSAARGRRPILVLLHRSGATADKPIASCIAPRARVGGQCLPIVSMPPNQKREPILRRMPPDLTRHTVLPEGYIVGH